MGFYTDFEKNINDLTAAESSGDKAKEKRHKTENGLEKQEDSIGKLDEKVRKQLDKEYASSCSSWQNNHRRIKKAEKFQTRSDHFEICSPAYSA